ncbi:hypothetical protein HBI57_226190, partial [Parastagonospora nodorum]
MRTSIVIAALAAFAVALPNPIPDVQDITNPAEHAQYRRDADAQTQPPRDAQYRRDADAQTQPPRDA